MPAKFVLAVTMSLLLFRTETATAGNLVVNGGFEQFTPPKVNAYKDRFSEIKPIGWQGGDGLTYITHPGVADDGHPPLSVWGPFPAVSPNGGYFVMAVGDAPYRDAIYQTLSGLTIGQKYEVSFYQAAGQAIPETDPTTERWIVSFGGSTKYSQKFSLPGKGVGPWELQTLDFIADATTLNLTFLADGTPSGGPPVSFLDGVAVYAVPEPGSMALSVLGMLSMGIISLRRRKKIQTFAQ